MMVAMGWQRFLPFLRWFPLRGDQVRADLLAGLALGLLVVPQSLAYAQLAGMPLVHGLYAALLPLVVGAAFGWCGQLTTGPVAMTALLTAAVLAGHAQPGDAQWVALAGMLAVLVGAIRIILGCLRAALLVSLLSHPVLLGFTAAAALIIAESQLAELVGVSVGRGLSLFRHLGAVITGLPGLHVATLAMGLGSMIALLLLKRWVKRIPAILPVAAIASVIAWATGYAAHGGRVVGELPTGLPPIGLPVWDWQLAWRMLPDALWLTLIGFLEVVTIAKTTCARTREPVDLNQELIGQGFAGIAAGCSGGFPVSGSLSRSAFNLANGARTGLSSIVAALLVLATLLVLSPLLHHLPLATLAAAIIAAVVPLIDIAGLRRAFRIHPHDGLAGVVTAIATLAFAPRMADGLLLGAGLAIALHLHRTMHPRVVELGRHSDGTLRDRVLHELPPVSDTVAVVRYDGRLYFANTPHFTGAIHDLLLHRPQVRWLLIAGDGLNEIDASGVEALRTLHRELAEHGIGLVFFGLKGQVQNTLDRIGLFTGGSCRSFRTIEAALDGIAAETPPQSR